MMILPGSPSALEAQTRIDREIAELNQDICKLQARIKGLYTQRNALSFVSRLPPEILSTVFIQYAQMHYKSVTPPSRKVPHWVNVSYVCRHWRNVALKCPTLWTYIFPASRSWTEALLSRSKLAPLKIWPMSSFLGSSHRPQLEQLLAHIERIQELRLMIPSYQPQRILSLLSSPAPLLQSLHVQWHDAQPNHTNTPRLWPFFDGVVPALRRLSLFGCAMPPITPMLCSLTTLILERSFRLTIIDLKTILDSARSLVHLELHNAFVRTSQELDSLDELETFRPPHLLRLEIEEPSYNVIKLLSWLDIPPQTEVRLRIYLLTRQLWKTLRPLIVKKLFSSGDNPYSLVRALALLVTSTATFALTASKNESCPHSSHDYYDSDWDCSIPLKLSLHGVLERDFIQDIIQDARDSGFFSALRSAYLLVDGVKGGCTTFLEDILSLSPELRCIEFLHTSDNLGLLFSLLARLCEGNQGRGAFLLNRPSEAMLVPALEELVITGSVFQHQDADPEHHIGRVANLYHALETRKEKGYPLKRLTLTGCYNVFVEEVALLKDVSAEVVWDEFQKESGFGLDEDVDERVGFPTDDEE